MEGTPALLCIPDITGFTEFMSESDLESSSKVIPSLLNKIIYTNTIGLKISEIEGDAILFYKTGELPSFEELLNQCHAFHQYFHKELNRLTNSGGVSAELKEHRDLLGLKIILHYGSINTVEVGTHLKLMGEDIIVAHRLLKNPVSESEYILMSQSLADSYTNENDSLLNAFQPGETDYDHIGKLAFYYHALGHSKTS